MMTDRIFAQHKLMINRVTEYLRSSCGYDLFLINTLSLLRLFHKRFSSNFCLISSSTVELYFRSNKSYFMTTSDLLYSTQNSQKII